MRRCRNMLLMIFLGLLAAVPHAWSYNVNASDYLPCINNTHTVAHSATLRADAFVKNGSATIYGSNPDLIVGNYSDGAFYETYLMFGLTSDTIQFVTLTVTYYLSKPNTPFTLSIYTTSTEWSQDTLNWTNRPKAIMQKGSVTIAPIDVGLPYFKFKFVVTGSFNSTMSFCLNASTPQDGGYIVSRSQEGASFDREQPLLEYGVYVTTCDTVPGFDIFLVLGCSSVAICILIARFKRSMQNRTLTRKLSGGSNP